MNTIKEQITEIEAMVVALRWNQQTEAAQLTQLIQKLLNIAKQIQTEDKIQLILLRQLQRLVEVYQGGDIVLLADVLQYEILNSLQGV